MESSNSSSEIKRAVIYLRVSTEEQVDNFSLETQERICTQEAVRRNMQVVRTFREEGKSAKTIAGRPALIEMLEYFRKNKKNTDALIIYRLDRLSRSTADYLAIRRKLAECQITLVSASEPTGNSPTERFIETMLAGFAQMDNDVRSERTRNGMKARFLAGLPNGTPAFGYKNENGYAVKDPKTWDLIKKSWELMGTGTKTLSEMATIMDEWGLRQPFKGKEYKLRPQAISRMFKNKFYMGILTSSRYPEEVRGQHIPMISESLFYRVQAVIDGRNTNLQVTLCRRNKNNPDFPLRRMVVCGNCGNPLTGAWSKGKHDKYAYYFCGKRCGTPSIAMDILETAVVSFLSTITPTQEGLDAFTALLRRTYVKRVTQLKKRRDAADTELKKLQELRRSLIHKNLSGVYSDKIFKEQNKLIEDQIADLQIAKDDTLLAKYNLEAIVKFMKEKFDNLGRTYQMSSLSQKRVLLCSISPSGMVWSYPGLSNTQISPIFQSIRMFETDGVSPSAPGGIRTCDLQFRKLTLYPTKLQARTRRSVLYTLSWLNHSKGNFSCNHSTHLSSCEGIGSS
jgi:site-specific DNA recombinase